MHPFLLLGSSFPSLRWKPKISKFRHSWSQRLMSSSFFKADVPKGWWELIEAKSKNEKPKARFELATLRLKATRSSDCFLLARNSGHFHGVTNLSYPGGLKFNLLYKYIINVPSCLHGYRAEHRTLIDILLPKSILAGLRWLTRIAPLDQPRCYSVASAHLKGFGRSCRYPLRHIMGFRIVFA